MSNKNYITFPKKLLRAFESKFFDESKFKKVESRFKKSDLYNLIEKGVVLEGPFKNLIYPKNESHGSSFYPKILGTYEKEIENVVNEIVSSDYDVIIDVGCAEGYYAVGFAKFSKCKRVYAYDTALKARELCTEMAKNNGVFEKVIIRSYFDLNEYKKILEENPDSKILIILDVEGYEKVLLTETFKKELKKTDFLIELHDFLDLEITEKINNFFKNVEMKKFFSLSDFQKALEYNSSYLKNLDFVTKLLLLKEGRPEQMKWYFIKSKNE